MRHECPSSCVGRHVNSDSRRGEGADKEQCQNEKSHYCGPCRSRRGRFEYKVKCSDASSFKIHTVAVSVFWSITRHCMLPLSLAPLVCTGDGSSCLAGSPIREGTGVRALALCDSLTWRPRSVAAGRVHSDKLESPGTCLAGSDKASSPQALSRPRPVRPHAGMWWFHTANQNE